MRLFRSLHIRKVRKYAKQLLIFFFVFVILGYKYSFQNYNNFRVRIGYSQTSFQDVPALDASAAISVYVDTFRDHIQKRLKKQIEFKSKIYNSVKEMNEDLNNNAVDLLSVSMEDYFQLKKTADITPCLAVAGNEGGFEQYCLLERNELVSKDYNSLRNKVFTVPQLKYHPMLEEWLYNILMKNKLPDMNKAFGKVIISENEQAAIYNLFFKKADLTVVRKSVWDVTCEFNPQLKNSITVINISKPMLLIFTVSNNKSDQSIIKIVIEEGLLLDHSPGGRNILNIFKAKKTVRITEDDLRSALEIINENNQYKVQSTKLKKK